MDLKHIQRTGKCLNCETVLDPVRDNFCPHCGQLNNTRKETALELVRELAGDFLHVDSKVTRNIGPLLFRPGKLTIDYINGKRARYFHPVRLFLIVTVIMFIVIGFLHKEPVKSKRSDMAFELSTENGLVLEEDTAVENEVEWHLGNVTITNDSLRYLIVQHGFTDTEKLMDTLGVEKTFFSRFLMSQAIKSHLQGFDKFGDYVKHKLPWIIFAFMPVFAFTLWLVYIRRRIFFSDHLIYAFHLHTGIFLIYTITSLLEMIHDAAGYLVAAIPVYGVVSLKKVYGQSWAKTILKSLLVTGIYFLLGVITIVVIMILLFVSF